MCSFISGCFQFNFWTPLPIESGSFIYSDKPCHLLSACTCDKTSVESHPYSMFVYVDTWQGNTRTQCPGPNIVDHNRGSGQTGFTPTACRLWHRQWREGPAAEEEREGGLLVNQVLSYMCPIVPSAFPLLICKYSDLFASMMILDKVHGSQSTMKKMKS